MADYFFKYKEQKQKKLSKFTKDINCNIIEPQELLSFQTITPLLHSNTSGLRSVKILETDKHKRLSLYRKLIMKRIRNLLYLSGRLKAVMPNDQTHIVQKSLE